MSYIGVNIRRLRKEREMTQENLADALQVSYQAISKWENGISDPDIMLLPHIAEIFGISLDELFQKKMKAYRNLSERYCSIYDYERTYDNFQRAELESRKLIEAESADDMDLRNRGILFQFCSYEFINEAEKLFKQVLMRNKKDDIYYRTQGQLVYHRQKMNRNDENIQEFEELIQKEPGDIYNYFMLIQSYNYAGRMEEAWDLVKHCLEIEPENANVLHYAGNVCYHLGHYDDALKYWRHSYKNNTDLCDNLHSIAGLYEQTGNKKQANEIYESIVKWLEDREYYIEAEGLRKKMKKIQVI